MKRIILFYALCTTLAWANLSVPNLSPEGETSGQNDGLIDPKVEYEYFRGRISDKSDNGAIFKIKVENNNTKFFKAGDQVNFRFNNHPTKHPCRGSVRSTEDFYFSLRVIDLKTCWDTAKYIGRGMQLNFESPKMLDRVVEASHFRKMLILKKDDFVKQLNKINHFLWSYNQQKIKVAADYDQRINDIKKERQVAMDDLLQQKKDYILLQAELQKKLDELDDSLNFYRIERQEYLTDRWNMGHDQALPLGQRPMEEKKQ